ncbi:DUF1128 domain-containing protein [Hazenella coriacea]|uniref:Uncharacterized protein YfkK (UPF0435 family) n=1 Tax=Hazenella coriacea TaxID=1179467 RepID=A0A4R3L9Y3_9BACL|nr:DUF1128 family protein [Hazenella coriacea]TCS95950.1 uncharacterized protein YfkK (UPF0435 family) [Hazenella coriacea]
MNLENVSQENLIFIVNEIKSNLKVVNAAIFNHEDFHLSQYEELLEIYFLVKKKKGQLSMYEVEGVLEELGSLRKQK